MPTSQGRLPFSLRYSLPLLAVLSVGLIAFGLWKQQQPQPPGAIEITPEMQAQAQQATERVLDVELLKGQVDTILNGLAKELATVTNVNEAHAFSESIKIASEHFGGLQAAKWNDDVKRAIAPIFKQFVTEFSQALTTAYKIPGVQQVLQSSAESLLSRVEGVLPPAQK